MAKENKQPKLKELRNTFKLFPFTSQSQPIILLILVGLIFNFTSLNNEYALDDGIIIHQNEYVLKGTKGIKDIMTKDAYDSFYRRMHAQDQLAGGRYRPLSVVSFALEQQYIRVYKTGAYTPNCWDTNNNGKQDPEEDLNSDGVYNEVDCQIDGAFLRHFNNMITYILGCVLLYLVFRNYMFKDEQDWAFLAALLFLMHPIHTEVVANVKSRDEIFSLIFISLTFFFSFKYLENKRWWTLFWAAANFFLALLSKEYAITLLGLVPCAIYVFKKEIKWQDIVMPLILPTCVFVAVTLIMVVMKVQKIPYGIMPLLYIGAAALGFGKQMRRKDISTLMIWFYASFLIYLSLRLGAVVIKPSVPDNEILNNPYLLANSEEKWATKIFVLLKYIILLVFPHPLSSDYSYNTIVYRHFSSWDTLVSLVLHISLAILAVLLFLKRNPLGFALFVYFAFMLMIGNIIMDIGATMGERLIFHSSIGFVIILSWAILNGVKLIPSFMAQRVLLFAVVGVIGFLYGCKTWERNWDWKNDITLFIKDVETVPNSVLVLGNAGARWIDLSETSEHKPHRVECLEKGIGYLKHAVELHPRYVNGYLNLGLAHYKLKKDAQALYYWKQAEKLYPNNPYLSSYYQVFYSDLLNRAQQLNQRGQIDSAIHELKKTIVLDSLNPEGWYNLGGAYFNKNDRTKAKYYWERCLKLNPNHALAKQGMNVLLNAPPVRIEPVATDPKKKK